MQVGITTIGILTGGFFFFFWMPARLPTVANFLAEVPTYEIEKVDKLSISDLKTH